MFSLCYLYHMELKHYLENYYRGGRGVSGFAARLNVTRQSVHNWISGKAFPSPRVAIEIERLTGGRVKGNDLSRTYRKYRERLAQDNAGEDPRYRLIKNHSVSEPYRE